MSAALPSPKDGFVQFSDNRNSPAPFVFSEKLIIIATLIAALLWPVVLTVVGTMYAWFRLYEYTPRAAWATVAGSMIALAQAAAGVWLWSQYGDAAAVPALLLVTPYLVGIAYILVLLWIFIFPESILD